jgi:hypothetical protein
MRRHSLIGQILLAALACSTSVAAATAAGSWIKTSSGPDTDSLGATSLHEEYVLPKSVKFLRGNYRTAYIKVTYAPGIRNSFDGTTLVTQIAQAMVRCNDLSWGTISEMDFDEEMKPVSSDVGEFDESKPIWTLKRMQPLSPSMLTYKTAKFICTVAT